MTKQQYIPITLDGEKVGTAQIQNHHLVLNIPDNNLRAQFWGEAEDLKVESISLQPDNPRYLDQATGIFIHTKESGNNNG